MEKKMDIRILLANIRKNTMELLYFPNQTSFETWEAIYDRNNFRYLMLP